MNRSMQPLNIPSLLKKYQLQPSKGLGQNFLMDESVLRKIVQVAGIKITDHVLEIGPGIGNLTRHLAEAAGSVTAVELDRKMIPLLGEVLEGYDNVRIVQGDILDLDPGKLVDTNEYLVVANIPYYITSSILRHLFSTSTPPRRIVLTIQKEVAERICTLDGKMSILALSVLVFGKPEIAAVIPAGSFHPAPKVDSAVLKIDVNAEPVIPRQMLDTFFSLVKAGFSQKRKNLRNSLSGGLNLPPEKSEIMLVQAGIDPLRRAETLSLEEWKSLVFARLTTSDR